MPEIVGNRLRRLADLVELGVSEPNRQRHGDAGCSGGGEGGVAMARLTSRRAFEAASNANHRPSGVSLAQLWRRSGFSRQIVGKFHIFSRRARRRIGCKRHHSRQPGQSSSIRARACGVQVRGHCCFWSNNWIAASVIAIVRDRLLSGVRLVPLMMRGPASSQMDLGDGRGPA